MRGQGPLIVGYDCVTPLGLELEDQWQAALAGKSGIGPLTRFNAGPDFPVSLDRKSVG